MWRCARLDDAMGVRHMVRKQGADVNARDERCGGATALHVAAGARPVVPGRVRGSEGQLPVHRPRRGSGAAADAVRSISLRLSLLRLLDSIFPANSIWAWEFHLLNSET